MKVARAGLAAVLLALAACSFTEGFDGFTGTGSENESAGKGDGAIASNNAPGDGGAITTTAGDAGGDGAAGDRNVPPYFVDGGSFCAGQTTASFCEDFDTADLGKSWLREGSFAKLTSYAAKSAPNDFVVNAPATTSGGTFVSKITHDFAASATSLVLTFDFQPEQTYLGSSFFILGAVEWTRGEAKYSLRLVYSSGQVRLEESNLVAPPNNVDAYHPFFDVPVGKWTKISLDIVATPGSPGVQISLDGVPVGTRETIAPTANLDPRPTLLLGAVYAGQPHSGWVLRYDDVTVSFR